MLQEMQAANTSHPVQLHNAKAKFQISISKRLGVPFLGIPTYRVEALPQAWWTGTLNHFYLSLLKGGGSAAREAWSEDYKPLPCPDAACKYFAQWEKQAIRTKNSDALPDVTLLVTECGDIQLCL